MKAEHPVRNQIPRLKKLWKEAFGDPEPFIELFFETAFSPERCLCLWAQDQLAGALYWFVCDLRGEKVAYLYAVATAKSFRRQGVCRRLMEDTHRLLRQKGFAGTVLVPANEELRRMYGQMGYRNFGGVAERTLIASERTASIRRLDAQTYGRLRREYLPLGSVLQEGENLRYLEGFCELYEGENFLLAGSREGDTFHAMECLGDSQMAAAVLKVLGCSRGIFRMPGEEKAFAMFHPLKETALPVYFGLDFG